MSLKHTYNNCTGSGCSKRDGVFSGVYKGAYSSVLHSRTDVLWKDCKITVVEKTLFF